MNAPQVRYTYDDLLETPDDGCRYEIIDGVLVAQRLAVELGLYQRSHGGEVFSNAVGLYFTHENYVEPDALYVARAPRPDRREEARGAARPRRRDLLRRLVAGTSP